MHKISLATYLHCVIKLFRFFSKNVGIKIYNSTIVPFVLYGCETLSLTLCEEHRLRVFENRVPVKNIWVSAGEIKKRLEKMA